MCYLFNLNERDDILSISNYIFVKTALGFNGLPSTKFYAKNVHMSLSM